MNFYHQVGELIFGTRLKRLSDKFFMDVGKVYKTLNIPFETSWFPIFYLLNKKGEMSVTAIAADLEITHSAVSQMLVNLEKKSLIQLIEDENDKRKKIVTFSKKGLELMDTVAPIWEAIETAMQNLFGEKNNNAYIPTVLDELEQSIEETSIFSRVIVEIEKHKHNEIDIVPYNITYQQQYKKLILSWLLDHDEVDIIAPDLINDPGRKIANKDAFVLMAKFNGDIVGIVVAKINSKDDTEILYLIVHPKWHYKQVEKILLTALKQKLQKRSIKNPEWNRTIP